MGNDFQFFPQMNRHWDRCYCLFISLFACFLKCLMIFSWQLGLPKVGLFEQISKFVCMKPISPALAGGLLTTRPSGKSLDGLLKYRVLASTAELLIQ